MDTRTAIVTGASSGIGLALAQAYQSRPGAVTLIQRFGLAANLKIHLHCLVLDGVYLRRDREANGMKPENCPA